MGYICPKGMYCVNGLKYKCLGGSYSPVEGLAICYECPPGFYCNENALLVTALELTTEQGTINPVECDPGHYCPS